MITFDRVWAMPNSKTFTIKPIKALISEYACAGTWLDPYAHDNTSRKLFGEHIITNDLNPVYPTDYHLDALAFIDAWESSTCDGVLFDPPYSLRQLKECYGSIGHALTYAETLGSWQARCKDYIARVVKPNGVVISFGWNTNGVGMKRGFQIERVLIVAHGGVKNDTLVTVERKQVKSIIEEISSDLL